jgi:hypothetical protein
VGEQSSPTSCSGVIKKTSLNSARNALKADNNQVILPYNLAVENGINDNIQQYANSTC